MTRADARFVAVAVAAYAALSTLSEFWIFLASGAVIAAIIARSVGFLYADTRMVSLCNASRTPSGRLRRRARPCSSSSSSRPWRSPSPMR